MKDIVHERAWVKTSAFAVEVKILAETRNRRHSRELFKMLRADYEEVQVLGFYDSPEDYVAGNLQGSLFEHVDEEEPFEGDMNKQYNADIIDEEYSEVRIFQHKQTDNKHSILNIFILKEDDTTDTSISHEQEGAGGGHVTNGNIDRDKMTSSSMSSNMDKITRRSSRNF